MLLYKALMVTLGWQGHVESYLFKVTLVYIMISCLKKYSSVVARNVKMDANSYSLVKVFLHCKASGQLWVAHALYVSLVFMSRAFATTESSVSNLDKKIDLPYTHFPCKIFIHLRFVH